MAFLSHRFCWKGSSQPCDLIKITDDMLIDLQVIHRYSVAVFLVNFTGQYTKLVFDLSRITSLLLPLAKSSPVCGFLQATSPRSLKYLKEYCRQFLDLTSAQNVRKLNVVSSDIPAVWSVLDSINKTERRRFLSRVVR